MRQTLADLCGLLQEQKEALRNMLELAKEERQIIINGESDKLEDVIRLELKELNKLGAVERKRLALHKVIAAELGLQEDELTVSNIAENADAEEQNIIRKLQTEIIPLIEEHAAVNKENRELIKAHLEYSETMLELMVGSEDPLNNMYGGDGRAAPDRKKSTGFYDGHA
ncbi:MAG: flagellar protein FlgN [Oscillospiraceae bacterium]|jgi:flagellar biosynthesis/type III secretory pathway chaperone|nr:flagellar protein FlgN [Oscillospiraceae bacterium]